MTSHPPSGPPSGPPSVPPSGPPSGPLSGPSTHPGTAGPPPPPPGPPHGGSGGGGGSSGSGGSGGGADGGGPGGGGSGGGGSGGGSGKGPWWRSVPKVASVAAVLVAAGALAVVLTNRPGGNGTAGSGGGEVFLQNAAATGPDPFTRSTARAGTGSAPPASLPPRTSSATPEVSGSTPGLYGGTQSVASCDVEQQVRYLSADPAKSAAFASVVGVPAGDVPSYLRSLTPLQLRADTRVTNHGFLNGSATSYQAVLQAGTAVMVDSHGVPRVRCACGNPLTGPVAQKAPRTTGTPWQGYRSSQVVVVAPSVTVVNVFVVYDPQDDSWFARQHGDTGQHDKSTPPPPPPTAPPSSSTSPSSPVPCVSGTGTPAPIGGVTPSPCPASPSSSSSSSSPPTTTTTPPTSSAPPPSDTSSPGESTSSSSQSSSSSESSQSSSAASSGPESSSATTGSATAATATDRSAPVGTPPSTSLPSAPAPGPGSDLWFRAAAGPDTRATV
ncbi:DUF6777 domain-containing protein [Streptomyces sp. NPDC092359]|uniref:DUF6777 domain-containing protein n=1 Tax=Streptomyces sp. NPDC092359 TaxID=3366014 RepID=UPI003806BFE5